MRKVSGLYSVLLKRIERMTEKYKKEITPFPIIFQKLGLNFSLAKQECWDALFTLRDFGFIEIIPHHGIRIIKDGN